MFSPSVWSRGVKNETVWSYDCQELSRMLSFVATIQRLLLRVVSRLRHAYEWAIDESNTAVKHLALVIYSLCRYFSVEVNEASVDVRDDEMRQLDHQMAQSLPNQL